MKIALIIAAGGTGKRFGQNKQLFLHQGKPLVIHTIEKFKKQKIAQLIIVAGDVPKFTKILQKYRVKYDSIVKSGKERCDSIRNGLAAVGEDITHVFIHDGARPNVSTRLLERLKKAAAKYDAVIPVLPVTDTIKVIKDSIVEYTPKRSELFAAQTPQCFCKETILMAYTDVDASDCTDDAMLVEKLGISVHAVPGEPENIKITRKEDLRLFGG